MIESHAKPTGQTLRPRLIISLIGLAMFALALGRFMVATDHTPFDRDEARWVYHAGVIHHLTDPLGPSWADSTVNRDQPPLAAYVLGIGMYAQGSTVHSVGWWNMSRSRGWNTRNGNMPSHFDLLTARRTNAVVGAFAVLALFLLVTRIANLAGGIGASLFLIAHPLMTQLASTADSDALLTLLLALAALAGMWLAERPGWFRALVLGALLGLGGAAKITPLFIAAGLVGAGVVVLFLARADRAESGERMRRLAFMLFVQPLVATVVFVAVSPYLWRDPIGHFHNLLSFRAQEMANQRRIWPSLAIASPLDTVHQVWQLLGMQSSASGWLVNQAPWVGGGSWRLPGVDLAIGLTGFVILGELVRRRGLASPTAIAAAILAGEALLALIGMRVYFPRYLMPLTLAFAAGSGVLVGAIWTSWARHRAGLPVFAAPEVAAGINRRSRFFTPSRRNAGEAEGEEFGAQSQG